MKREYDTGTDEHVSVFIGKEIEHTPAYGMYTLFVVGVIPVDDIKRHLADQPQIKHIFFGANHSFGSFEQFDEYDRWTDMIIPFLEQGLLCSLDIPLSEIESFNDFGFNEYHNFIPQIRVPIPYVESWNYNTMIKIDDKDFNSSNPGVWTHSLHELMDRKCFTSWDKYALDKILK